MVSRVVYTRRDKGSNMSFRTKSGALFSAAIIGLAMLGVSSNPASAAIFNIADHPDGSESAIYEYGLRLDGEDKFFSMDGASTAQLFVDTTNGTASIMGTVIENSDTNNNVATWTISYVFSGVSLVGMGGEFTASGGAGTVTEIGGAMEIINMIGKQKSGTGIAFSFLNDGHRLPGNTGLVGRGWIQKHGTNDFLFTATVVPLPPAALLFGSALAGMGFLGRRRKQKATAA